MCIRSCICNLLGAIATLIVQASSEKQACGLHSDLLDRTSPVSWPGGAAADFSHRPAASNGSPGSRRGQSAFAKADVPIPKTHAEGITDQALRRNQRRNGGDDDCDQRPAPHSAAATI